MRMRETMATEYDPPMGMMLWEMTGLVSPYYPIQVARGTLRGEGYVYMKRRGRVQRRLLVEPSDPKTPLQLTRREAFGEAVHVWSSSELSDAQRAAWQGYALTHFWPGCTWKTPALAGMNGFRRVHVVRLALGMGVMRDPPLAPPPPAAARIAQEPAPDATSFAFRLEHRYAALKGARLQVEITPAMPTLRRMPCENQYRWACQDSLACHPQLKESGGVYVVRGARYEVEAGRRYGTRVSLVSPQGVPGETLTDTFIKDVGSL